MNVFEIGVAIRVARKSKDLTQAQLALEAGLSRQTVIQLESGGYSEIGIRKVMNVLSILDLHLEVGDRVRAPHPFKNEVPFELCVQEDDEHPPQPVRPRTRPRL